MSKPEIAALIEGSRQSFEEKAWIKYFMFCEKNNLQAMPKQEFLAIKEDDNYQDDYVQSLWLGWQWCYEICKISIK